MSYKYEDHIGNKFNSVGEMIKYYGITHTAYYNRKKRGWSLERILTTPVGRNKVSCKDHLGTTFESTRKMCEHYNIHYGTYKSRIRNGHSVKDALTTPSGKLEDVRDKSCYDHIGNKFQSKDEMCAYYKITKNTFEMRLWRGMSLEKALTYNSGRKKASSIIYKGVEYSSLSALCKQYNLVRRTVKVRLDRGMSLEDAINEAKSASIYSTYDKLKQAGITDAFGNNFKYLSSALKFYNINRDTYDRRISRGKWSLKEALGISGRGLKARVGTTFHNIEFIKYLYKGRDGVDYYLCKVDGVEKIVHENNWLKQLRI